MGFSVGIVGLPNVGKSTLFKALTKQSIDISNYPFCTIDPNVGVVAVPDPRLQQLSAIFNPPKTIPTAIEFVDIAGLVQGAHKGEGLGNKFLANIAQVDAIAHIVRCFSDEDIIHVAKTPNPKRDIETINLELILKDLSNLENALARLQKEAKSGNSLAIKKFTFFEKLKILLERGEMASTIKIEDPDEYIFIREVQLLTYKPMLFVLNSSETETTQNIDIIKQDLQKEHPNAQFVVINTKLETEYHELSPEDIKELDLPQSQIDNFIKACYETLNLITFYTAGETEVRAWTIPKNATAPQAGAAIHTDFQTKFIRAEIIRFEDFLKAGSYGKARELGLLKTEGREYIVKDGDIITFKI